MLFQNDFKVIDIHGHLPGKKGSGFIKRTEIGDQYNTERSKRMMLSWDFPHPSEETDEKKAIPIMDRWVQELDRYGIERFVFLTAEDNDDLAKKIKEYPGRFIGFAHHPIENRDALQELKRATEELGLKGYKMFGPLVNRKLHDDSLMPVWEYLAEKQIPVLIHFGLLGRAGGIVEHQNMSPLSIFQVAREFPELPIIIPHFGAGYFQELLHLCWSCPNVYVDTSGSNQWMRWMPYHLDLEILFRKTYELIGAERIIFGTDSNGFPRGYSYRYLQDQVRVCREINMREEDIEKIFGNNARRLFNLEIGVKSENVTQ
ncbi:amidohydrolase family protein [Litchfieldia alkalitelluris]|uniref:amidohydrolase family protein n=1 Tax=Litchfieldia alkalitelluris TaxID=304268 RepID=UPI0009989D28|nr:amidohydrolase family protein [Litchfieldia alkalitelluris]